MILAIDIGGTTIKIGIVKNQKITKKYSIMTNRNSILNDILESLSKNKIDIFSFESIGISVPGFIDHKNGIIKKSGNLNWNNYDFKSDVESKFELPVSIINDANAAALGEYWLRKDQSMKSIIFYTLGTGVGGGVIINDKLVFGAHGYAGEFGHGGNFQNERKCSCGLNRCIEPMSSAFGIEMSLKNKFKKNLKIIDVAKAFKNGEKEIVEVFKNSLRPLARHIIVMQTALNPDAIIIGGGPSNLGKPLSNLISDLVKEEQLDFISSVTPILIAKQKNNAGILGAAYWSIINSK